jgi:4-hydroxy-tetrahydrodipicolinate synthase
MKPLFVGSGVALVTPFGPDGVNERVLRELVSFHVREGTDALLACGSTGEAATMKPAEQARAIEVVAEEAAGRVPVIGGIGGSDTAAVVELGRAAHAAGADALLISPPPYNKPSQRGILAHFRSVMAAVDLPVIVYNIPGRTAVNILPETIEELAEDPRVVGVKEASGDIVQIGELARRLSDRLAIYSGNDDQILPILSLGGVGVISVLANLAPRDVSRLVHRFLAGDIEEARRLQFRYLPLARTLFSEPNPVPVKAGVGALGFDAGSVRLPLLPPTEETLGVLWERMREVGLPIGDEA